MKKIFLLALPIIALSNCDYYYQYTQCDPDLNYLNVNIEAIEEYEELIKKGLVQSHYKKVEPSNCPLQTCLHDYKNGQFYESYLDTMGKKGIYTIYISKDTDNDKCYFKPKGPDKNCYIIEKNVDNVVKSRYHFHQYTQNNVIYRKFIDTQYNKTLLDSAFQFYSTPNISGIGSGGICSTRSNHHNYKINSLKYPLF